MASIVYRTIKGTKYAYSSESYWDSEKKAPRTRRTYLGKVDPESGEIIRVYKKKAVTAENVDVQLDAAKGSAEIKALLLELEDLKREVIQLREQNASLTAKFTALKGILDSVS